MTPLVINFNHDDSSVSPSNCNTQNGKINRVKGNKKSKQQISATHNNVSVNAENDDSIKEVAQNSEESVDNESSSNIPSFHIFNADMSLQDLHSLSKEEKKKRLLAKIAEMEKQLEDEEDQELQELLSKHDQLKRKLSHSTPTKAKTKKTKKGKLKVHASNENLKRKNKTKLQKKIESKVAVENFYDDRLPSLTEIQNLLQFTEKQKSPRKEKRKANKRRPSSESSDYKTSEEEVAEESDSDEASSPEMAARPRKKGKHKVSGLYAKPGNVRLLSNELFAHVALDDDMGGHRDRKDLSFNLLVAGELEIISSKDTPKEEKFSRIEVLKKLAYKSEHLPREEILKQYANFVHKIEKGKFSWGSKKDLEIFEHQLIYNISINRASQQDLTDKYEKSEKCAKFKNRKKYCLDFNRGSCKFNKGHEGKINGQLVFKEHICRKCLVNDNIESECPEKDCNASKK